MPTASPYSKLHKFDLEEKLENRGLCPKGNRDDLIRRLEEDDKKHPYGSVSRSLNSSLGSDDGNMSGTSSNPYDGLRDEIKKTCESFRDFKGSPQLFTNRSGRNSTDRDPNDTSTDFPSSDNQSFLYVLLGFAVIVFAFLLWTVLPTLWCPSVLGTELRKVVGKEVGSVLQRHPECANECRLQMKVAFDRWLLNSHSREPVVIILQLPPKSNLLKELVDATAKGVQHSTGVVECYEYTKRAALHNNLQTILHESNTNFSTVGLRNIDQLHWDAPLVLQSFSDAERVDSSRPLLWMSMEEGKGASGRCEQDVNSRLTSSWISTGGNEDNVPPVVSRIMQFTICLTTGKDRKEL